MSTLKINQALVCLDLSSLDDTLMDYLNFLSSKVKIDSMYFLHVIKKPGFLSGIFGSDESLVHSEFVLNEDIIKHLIENVESKLVSLEDINVEFGVTEGTPLTEILKQTAEHHAELLVIGKKPLSASAGVLGRSLARRSQSSILFVPENSKKQLDTIMVPVDFSENSGKALKKAIELNYSLENPAKIVCVHVFEMPDLNYYKINKTYEQLKGIVEKDMQDAFDRFLEKYAPNMGDLLEKQSVEREQLSTAGQLISLCETNKADLVILGAKGHSLIESIFIGSVTEKFMQQNDEVPTLIVR